MSLQRGQRGSHHPADTTKRREQLSRGADSSWGEICTRWGVDGAASDQRARARIVDQSFLNGSLFVSHAFETPPYSPCKPGRPHDLESESGVGVSRS
jgi:hypothetical protein